MLRRHLKYYLGVWVPLAASWVLVVFIAAWRFRAGLGVGLLAAVFGSMAAIAFAAFVGREQRKGSLGFVASHAELSESELLRHGFRKGVALGVASILGVALLLLAPQTADRILTALGK
jgi:hypothetical protein